MSLRKFFIQSHSILALLNVQGTQSSFQRGCILGLCKEALWKVHLRHHFCKVLLDLTLTQMGQDRAALALLPERGRKEAWCHAWPHCSFGFGAGDQTRLYACEVLYSKPYSSPGCLSLHKNSFSARRWWLTPVILATQEAEIRRKMVVQSQPRQIVHETLSQKKTITKKSWW
jgi:hypothetical protein